MGDMAEYGKALKEYNRERKKRNLAQAQNSTIPWTKHTPYHWSYMFNGHRLDYWPSRNKFRYMNKTRCGDVEGFINNRKKTDDN